MSKDETSAPKKKVAPKKKAAPKKAAETKTDSKAMVYIKNIKPWDVVKVLFFILLMVFSPFFPFMGNWISNANNLALYYLVWFILLLPYFNVIYGLLNLYYRKILNKEAKDKMVSMSIVSQKDVAAVLLITVTVGLLFGSFNIIGITDFAGVQGQLIAILGMIGGAYAAARNPDKRNTLGMDQKFAVRAIVAFLALIGIIFGSVTQIRILFVEIIAITLGRSIDKN